MSTPPLDTRLYRLPVVSLDFEATGLSAWRGDRVCEVGMVRGVGEDVSDLFTSFVNPGKPIPEFVQQLTGIKNEDVADAPSFDAVFPEIETAIGSDAIVIHNAPFDLAFLKQGAEELGRPFIPNVTIDTLLVARFLNRGREGNSLSQMCDRLGIDRGSSHRATDDARSAAHVFHALVPYLEVRGLETLGDLVQARLAAPSEILVAEPSSVLLDMLSRALDRRDEVEIDYAAKPGERLHTHRVRLTHLLDDRMLVGQKLSGSGGNGGRSAERTYRVDRIMRMTYGDKVFISPWCDPELID